MKIGISKDGDTYITGSIEYNEETKELTVVFPDKEVEEAVIAYLTTEQEFQIPVSQQIDDFRVDTEVPTKNDMYFSLALSSMWANTGVWVHWETKER